MRGATATDHEMLVVKALALFVLTAFAEIVGCYLPYLWLKKEAPAWLLVPAAGSLALFVWLLSLHLTAAGRGYAACTRRSPSPGSGSSTAGGRRCGIESESRSASSAWR
jgi:hypothetical protein